MPDSPGHWRDVRRLLNAHRHELAAIAATLYPLAPKVGGTVLLCRPEWVPTEPLDLGDLALSWSDGAPPDLGRASGYASELAAIERPALLENRVTYRLLAADLTGGSPSLTFGSGHYFDWVNTGEAVAHELAGVWKEDQNHISAERLRLRTLIGDPCDLRRRSALTAVSTLTLRVPAVGEPTFLLHWRDPARVTHAGGLYQVMPVGVFQPTAETAAARRADFDLWRSMAREFSEEFLGAPESYGTAVDYPNWPFYQALSAARAAGKLRVVCLGLGTDPLTLATDALTVAAFASDVFDELFGRLVTVNDEGRVVKDVPFRAEVVNRFAGGAERVQAAGAAVLGLAWRHRRQLL